MELELEPAGGEPGVRQGGIAIRFDDPRWNLYIGLIVLNVFDVITTMQVLERGGAERNPFVQPLVHDIWLIAGMKAAVLGLVAGLLTRCPGSRVAQLALACAAGWYLAVVTWNTVVLTIF